jgi:hypothetical protein
MQNEIDIAAHDRKRAFAKTLMCDDRQVLLYLIRNEDDRLSVVFVIWIDSDEQFQAVITPKTEEEAQSTFDMIDETLARDLIDYFIGASEGSFE